MLRTQEQDATNPGAERRPHTAVQAPQRLSQPPQLMDTPRQADLFDGDPDARECVSCGDSFVPDWDSDKLCDDCYERKQRRPQKNASDAELME